MLDNAEWIAFLEYVRKADPALYAATLKSAQAAATAAPKRN